MNGMPMIEVEPIARGECLRAVFDAPEPHVAIGDAVVEQVAERQPAAVANVGANRIVAIQHRRIGQSQHARVDLRRATGLVVTSGGVLRPRLNHIRYSKRNVLIAQSQLQQSLRQLLLQLLQPPLAAASVAGAATRARRLKIVGLQQLAR